MAIENTVNPVTNAPMTMVDGVIERITFKELSNDRFGNTHRASLLVDGVWINNINLKVNQGREPKLQKATGQKPNLKWEDIQVGDHIRAVLKVGEFNGKPSYSTGTSQINIIKKGDGQIANQNATATTKGNAPQKSQGVNIYGDVLSVSGANATVKDSKSGVEHKVVLSTDQQKEVVVGGRMGAYIDGAGTIVNNYRWYPAKASNGNVKSDAYGSPERQFKMSFGNAVNVAAILEQTMQTGDVFKLAQDLFEPCKTLRENLLSQYKGVRSEDDLGGKLGDAFKHAAVGSNSIGEMITKAEVWVNKHIDAENHLKDKLEGKTKEATEEEEEVYEAEDIPQDNFDYDDDVPF